MRGSISVAAAALLVTSIGCARPPATTAPVAAVPLGPRELTSDEQVVHVLDRLAFGPRPGDVERVRAMGVDRWIEQQLHPEHIADPASDAVRARFPLLDADPRSLLDDATAARGNGGADSVARRALQMAYNAVGREVQAARLVRATTSERQLQEVLVDLWANHFSVFANKGPVRLYLARYEDDAIRPHVLGKFRDLLGAVAHSPAMLFYLDNWQSAADSLHPTLGRRPGAARGAGPRGPRGLNENYARELLELHTLGVDGGYTQQDVIEVARALTGWSIEAPRQGGGFVFRPALHDAGAKTVLGVRIPAGGGERDGERVLDILAQRPATARMVATTLTRRFVSDDPPPALVDRAAATYLRTDGDLRETLRVIITSPEFFSRAAFRSKVKSPLELVASALRATGVAADTTPRAARAVAQLGEPLYGRLTPDGWPERSREWLSAGSVADRVNFIAQLTQRTAPPDSLRTVLESADFQRR